MSKPLKIGASVFKTKVLENALPVLVDFYADWCNPCRMIAPVIEEISSELSDSVEFFKVDVDAETELAAAYGVMSIPTMILFRDGEESGRLIGANSKEKILEFLGK